MGSFLFGHVTSSFNQFRQLLTSSTVHYSSVPTPSSPNPAEGSGAGIRKVTTLTGLQKWALVFSGKYKNKADIPHYVPVDVLERARSRARIKVSNILMLLTIVACLGYAYSGRAASGRGESVSQMNLDWHKDYKAQVENENKDRKK